MCFRLFTSTRSQMLCHTVIPQKMQHSFKNVRNLRKRCRANACNIVEKGFQHSCFLGDFPFSSENLICSAPTNSCFCHCVLSVTYIETSCCLVFQQQILAGTRKYVLRIFQGKRAEGSSFSKAVSFRATGSNLTWFLPPCWAIRRRIYYPYNEHFSNIVFNWSNLVNSHRGLHIFCWFFYKSVKPTSINHYTPQC